MSSTPEFAVIVPSESIAEHGPVLSPGAESCGSGREFHILGESGYPFIQTVANRAGELAVIGSGTVSDLELRHGLDKALACGKPEVLADLPGNNTAVLIENGRVSVVGDIIGHPSVYFSHTSDATIISSRPSFAAQSDNLKLDAGRIAAHLAIPAAEAALTGTGTTFIGVSKLLGGQMLQVGRDGCRISTYESLAPDANATLEDAAERLREALVAAIKRPFRLPIPVSADLSGGMDSTSVALIASSFASDRFPVYFANYLGLAAGDADYVRQVVTENPKLSLGDIPPLKNGLSFSTEDFTSTPRVEDLALAISMGPTSWRHFSNYYGHIGSAGRRLHFTGDGGDEVVGVPTTYLADLLSSGNVGRFGRDTLSMARLYNISPFKLFKQVASLSSNSPAGLLRSLAEQLPQTCNGSGATDFSPRLGDLWTPTDDGIDWLTRDAKHVLIGFIRDQARELDMPKGMGMGDFIAREALRCAGQSVNMLAQYSQVGNLNVVPFSPLLDPNVVKAAFSLPSYMRRDPAQFKPLLRKALWGIVPEIVLSRRTKGEYDEMHSRAYEASRETIREIIANSILIQLGIIDPRGPNGLLERIDTANLSGVIALERFLATESWAQGLDASKLAHKPFGMDIAPRPIQLTRGAPKEWNAAISNPDIIHDRVAVPAHILAASSEVGSLALFDEFTDRYLTLNRHAARIIRTIARTGSVKVAIEQITEQFPNIDPKTIEQDVINCTADAMAAGVLMASETEPARNLPNARGPIGFTEAEASGSRSADEKINSSLLMKISAVSALAGSTLIARIAPHYRRPILKFVQDTFANRDATPEEGRQFLYAVQKIPTLGRVACLEASYAASLAAGLGGLRLDWHRGVSFFPLQYHAWTATPGGSIVRSPLDGQVTGSYESFFD